MRGLRLSGGRYHGRMFEWATFMRAEGDPSVRLILVSRGMRAFADGYVAVLMPAYLLALGFDTADVGLLSTATLLGSALATLAVGAAAHRFRLRSLLRGAALLMALTGCGFAALSEFWPLLLVAFVGTLNPSSGDVSVFLPLEHARLSVAAATPARTGVFARYALTGSLCAAAGGLAAGLPAWLASHTGASMLAALRTMFVLYGAIGSGVWLLYRRLPQGAEAAADPAVPLGPSRRIVMRLAALFSVDAFAGGLVVQSLLALWLFRRFDLSPAEAGMFFFWAGLLTAGSQLAAPRVAHRIGLLKTMVFTHIPANVCLMLAALAPSLPMALALLLVRAALSQMDVPTRSAFVMALVTPGERAAAASFTAVPRSLASALSPSLGGALFAAGALAAPLVLCGALKLAYDLAMFTAFRRLDAAAPPR